MPDDYEREANYYASSGGVIGPASAYDICRTCHGNGLEVIGGRTPEGDVMPDVECSTCKGTGKREPVQNKTVSVTKRGI